MKRDNHYELAFEAYLQLTRRRGIDVRPRPAFGHGAVFRLPGGETLVGCYHPSRQNTQTRKLTPRMMDAVFGDVRRMLTA